MNEYIELETGFSVELELTDDWKLEARGKHEGLPLYESIGGKITAIAIVKDPAIKRNAIAIDKEQTIMGPVMIPDIKMFRNLGPKGPENCYWYFTAETLKHLKDTFGGHIKIGH